MGENIKFYGIKNCDTVKKAMNWLKENNIPFDFHDYKNQGISQEKLEQWCSQLSWEDLVNKKGTTWRKLDEGMKAAITGKEVAIDLMRTQTSVIRRPVIEKDGKVVAVGFEEEFYKNVFSIRSK